jgi:hypothetical protein
MTWALGPLPVPSRELSRHGREGLGYARTIANGREATSIVGTLDRRDGDELRNGGDKPYPLLRTVYRRIERAWIEEFGRGARQCEGCGLPLPVSAKANCKCHPGSSTCRMQAKRARDRLARGAESPAGVRDARGEEPRHDPPGPGSAVARCYHRHGADPLADLGVSKHESVAVAAARGDLADVPDSSIPLVLTDPP